MFCVLDPDTILIMADMSGLDLKVENFSEVRLDTGPLANVTLNIDLDPDPVISGGLTSAEVLVIVRSENVFANYKTQEVDEAGLTTYIGQVKTSGEWFISRLVDTAGDLQITYANISNNGTMTTFSLAWTNRASLSYTLISSLTGV